MPKGGTAYGEVDDSRMIYVNSKKTVDGKPWKGGKLDMNKWSKDRLNENNYITKEEWQKRYDTNPEFKAAADSYNDSRGGAFSVKRLGGFVEDFAKDAIKPAAIMAAPYLAALATAPAGASLLSGAGGGAASSALTNTAAGVGGASGASGAAAATNALNPTGAGFTGTGPGVAGTGGSNALSTNAALGGAGSLGGTTTQSTMNALNNAANASNAPAGTLPSSGTPASSGAPDWLNPALIGGSSLISGYLSNQATDKGIDEIKRQYDQTRADMEPWRQSGIGALDKLNNFDINTITEDPMYQLANEEGLRAINRGNSARGLNLSGNALIDEARTGAAIASDYGNNVWNRQAGLAGVGQAATNNLATLGQNTSNNLANLYNQQGQGLNNAIQGGISNYLTYDMNKNYRNPYMSPYSQYYNQV